MPAHAGAVEELDGRCNCLAARQASRYLTAVYDQALSPAELRATQFSILYKLVKGGPLTIGEIASRMAMDRTTLSTNLKPLERNNWIVIVPGVDRRAKQALITQAGLLRYQQALPLWEAVQSQFEKNYGKQRAADLRNTLRAVLRTGFEPWAENLLTQTRLMAWEPQYAAQD